MFKPEQIELLSAPLNKANVKSRSQAGRELSYVEAWHAIAEANRVFGFDGWDRETVDLRQLGDVRMVGDKARVGYSARVRITVRANGTTIVREGCGFGSGIDKDADQAHESALKEAESDAMKRGLMTFGNIFGLALYDKTQSNVVEDKTARDFAAKALNASKDLDDMAAIWASNAKAWRSLLSAEDFAYIEKIKDSLKITLSAGKEAA